MAIPVVSDAVTKVELAPAAALFRSLGDPTRLAILRRLATGEARVGELVEDEGVLGIAGPFTSDNCLALLPEIERLQVPTATICGSATTPISASIISDWHRSVCRGR